MSTSHGTYWSAKPGPSRAGTRERRPTAEATPRCLAPAPERRAAPRPASATRRSRRCGSRSRLPITSVSTRRTVWVRSRDQRRGRRSGQPGSCRGRGPARVVGMTSSCSSETSCRPAVADRGPDQRRALRRARTRRDRARPTSGARPGRSDRGSQSWSPSGFRSAGLEHAARRDDRCRCPAGPSPTFMPLEVGELRQPCGIAPDHEQGLAARQAGRAARACRRPPPATACRPGPARSAASQSVATRRRTLSTLPCAPTFSISPPRFAARVAEPIDDGGVVAHRSTPTGCVTST